MTGLVRIDQANPKISAASRNAALAKMVPENLRDQGSMNRPLSTNVLPGKAFEPSEVKAVGVPR